MQAAIPMLVRFSHLVAEASGAEDILPLLAGAGVDVVHADAAIVAQVRADGEVAIAATKNVDCGAWSAPPEVLGAELGDWALAASSGAYRRAHVRLMIANADLFGALVLLFKDETEPEASRFEIADALVDLTATALAKAEQVANLRRAHASLEAAQQALVRSEKLRALGQMAAGVSHDLKNILSPLWLHLQIIERGAKRGRVSDVVESAEEMRQVLTRGLQTVERLRDYARQQPESLPELVDLDAVVAEAATIAKARIASRGDRAPVRLVLELGAPPKVMGRTADVVNAVVNLVVNAIDALANGGTVTLRTGVDGGASVVSVADDGPGMSADVEERIFEPFFTTKGDEGTGLGLAMVFACMNRHGGSVQLATEPGAGARFTLRFPPIG